MNISNMTTNYTGAYIPKRKKKDVMKDTSSLELACASAPVWKEKKKWKKYTERNQANTYTCMAQSGAKIMEVINPKIVFSASPIYAERINKKEKNELNRRGMWLGDLLDIITNKFKLTTEKRIPSQFLKSDAQIDANALKFDGDDMANALKYSPEKYGYCSNDIDEIAGHLESGIGLVLVTFANNKEWGQKFPVVIDRKLTHDTAPICHGVAIVDYGTIKGKKYLKIEDSAHFGGLSERWIDQAWLNERCSGVGFVVDLGETPDFQAKPSYVFNRDLKYGMLKDKDVVQLQNALKWLGLMDKKVPSTGNFLGETFRSVIKFQEKYRIEILASLGLREATGYFGKSSRKKMNELLK